MSAGFIFNNEYVDVTHTAPTALGNEGWWWQSSNLNPTRDYILPFGVAPATLTVNDDNNQMLYSTTQSLSSRHFGKLMRAKLIPEDTADFTYTDIVYTKVSDTEFSISYTEHDINAGESYNVAITYVLKESAFEMPIENFDLQDKTVNSNGTVTPDQGYYGLGSVNVQVPDRQVNLQNKSIASNGTFTADQGYDGLGTVTVNVPTTGNRMYAWAEANDNWDRIQWNTNSHALLWSSVPSPEVGRMLIKGFYANNSFENLSLNYVTVTEVVSDGRLTATTNSSTDNNPPHTFKYIRYPSLDFTI